MIETGDLRVVSALLRAKSAVNARDQRYGQTALMHAINYNAGGLQDIIDMLLNHQADVNIQDNDGSTALLLACGELLVQASRNQPDSQQESGSMSRLPSF